MSFARLRSGFRFLSLGLLWGVVAGAFHIENCLRVSDYQSLLDGDVEVRTVIPLIIVMIVGTCPIAALLGRALLKPDLSSISWSVNWVITGVASSAGGVAIFWLVVLVWGFAETGQIASSLPDDIDIVERLVFEASAWLFASLGFGILIGVESAVVAVLLAPLSLLARWLIVRRTRVGEPLAASLKPSPEASRAGIVARKGD